MNLKVGPSKKIIVSFFLLLLLQLKPFKNDEICFLFHLESSFRSQDLNFCLDSLVM